MSGITGLSVPAAASFQIPPEMKPANTAQAAQQFEALLIAQMLRSARESAGGDDQDDAENSTMLEVAEQQFAQIMAQEGGIGLGRMLIQGLRQAPPASAK